MAEICQELGAATLWTIERFAAKAPEEASSPEVPARKWRFLPSVGTWVLPKTALAAQGPRAQATPKKVAGAQSPAHKVKPETRGALAKPGTPAKMASVASPKAKTQRSPRRTAPAVPVMAAPKAAEKVVPSLTKKTLLGKSASSTLTPSEPKAAPHIVKPSTAPAPAQPRTPRGSPVVPRVASTVRLAGRTPSTAEIEAQHIEEKRKQARFLAERNARRMNRIADPVRSAPAKKEQAPTSAPAPTTATSPGSAPSKPTGPTRRDPKATVPARKPEPTEPAKGTSSASRGLRIATAPTPIRNARVVPPQRKSPAAADAQATKAPAPAAAAKTAPTKPGTPSPRPAILLGSKPRLQPRPASPGTKKAPPKPAQADVTSSSGGPTAEKAK